MTHSNIQKLLPILVLATVLTGCAKSTTQGEWDCPMDNGVPVCLDTYDVDVKGDIPKSGGAAKASKPELETQEVVVEESLLLPKKETMVVVEEDTTYPVKPMIRQPVRQNGSTERMWFASWEDTQHDLYIDQQYIYWTEKGRWAIGE